ncbi:MAG: hypothetical protein H6817_06910 [Phycisphaerales bacterium]|nr:hypothetical protein [Phycisphaerales bacterium]
MLQRNQTERKLCSGITGYCLLGDRKRVTDRAVIGIVINRLGSLWMVRVCAVRMALNQTRRSMCARIVRSQVRSDRQTADAQGIERKNKLVDGPAHNLSKKVLQSNINLCRGCVKSVKMRKH